ncbi:hypothetical protein GGTG_04807 [Gaeumannomyces tritici R3-111a-1]|uniref:Uncharacterized protein n=1 Tax=Gaeumannomyces tritici (strain R3-111a-1) TaxID=644352 RepID=J3NU52_GAET3|nr:hypothetical protein GGTG_04807 [Gaeumannomyces tritici R3-111a-1]EJT79723.1 hypothetical protein GGTG_04807 [Gaeumannomyces tritici R3-111a-1]
MVGRTSNNNGGNARVNTNYIQYKFITREAINALTEIPKGILLYHRITIKQYRQI